MFGVQLMSFLSDLFAISRYGRLQLLLLYKVTHKHAAFTQSISIFHFIPYQVMIPRTHRHLANRVFAVAVPSSWNSLPDNVRDSESYSNF